MIAAYLGLTGLLAALDAIASLSALVAGVGDAGGTALGQLLWLLVSIPILFLFTSRGYWPGAPSAHIAYVAAGAFVYAAVPTGSLLFPAFRVVGSLALLVLLALVLRAVVTKAADDGEPPPNLVPAVAVTAVVAAVAAGVAPRINGPIEPVKPAAPSAPAPTRPPQDVSVTVFGRVLRPDGLTLPGTIVTFEAEGPDDRRFQVRGETSVKVDRQGRFSFQGVSKDRRAPCRLTFDAPGYKKKTVSAFASGESLDVTLSPDL